MAKHFSDTILDTIETFLDGAPDLEEADVQTLNFSEHLGGENETVRMMTVTIDGEAYLVVVKKVGGA